MSAVAFIIELYMYLFFLSFSISTSQTEEQATTDNHRHYPDHHGEPRWQGQYWPYRYGLPYKYKVQTIQFYLVQNSCIVLLGTFYQYILSE